MSVTPAGETFVSYARRILELADEAILAVTAPEETTLLHVGFAGYLVPQQRFVNFLLACIEESYEKCKHIIFRNGHNGMPDS